MNHTPSKLFQYQNFYIVIMGENNIQTERLYWFCILRYQKRLNTMVYFCNNFMIQDETCFTFSFNTAYVFNSYNTDTTFYHCDCFSVAQNKCPFVLPSDWISNKFAYSCRTHKALLQTRTKKKIWYNVWFLCFY